MKALKAIKITITLACFALAALYMLDAALGFLNEPSGLSLGWACLMLLTILILKD